MKRTFLLIAAAAAALGTTAVQAQRQGRGGSKQALRRAVQDAVTARGGAVDRSTRYQTSLVDLNGDARAEAIVYVSGPNLCGSGGCNMLVLTQGPAGWRVVTRTTVTNPPIRLLSTRSRGWRDLGVGVSGGGVRAHEAVLSYNGRSYPTNPTMVSARRGALPAGRVLIDDVRGELLFGGGGQGSGNAADSVRQVFMGGDAEIDMCPEPYGCGPGAPRLCTARRTRQRRRSTGFQRAPFFTSATPARSRTACPQIGSALFTAGRARAGAPAAIPPTARAAWRCLPAAVPGGSSLDAMRSRFRADANPNRLLLRTFSR